MKSSFNSSHFKLHYVFYSLSAIVTVLIVVLSTIYLKSYYNSERSSLEHTLLENLDLKVEMINKSLADTEANLGYIEAYTQLSLKYKNIARDQKALADFLSRIIAPYPDQYNAYAAWNADKSREFCDSSGCVNVVRKNQKFLNSADYGDFKNIEFVRYKDPFYQTDHSELWYYLPTQNQGIVYTPVYFDTNYMKIYMFSCVKAIYDQGRIAGVIGIDMPILNFSQRIAEFEKILGGYVYIVNETGEILEPFASANGAAKRNVFQTDGTKKQATGLHEVRLDGKVYLSASKKIKLRDWHVVVYKDKAEAYAQFQRQLAILLILGILVTVLLIYASLWVGNVLTHEVDELVTNLEENSKILDHSANGEFKYIPYSGFALAEFSHISRLWNAFLAKLKDAISRYENEKQKATVAKQTQTIFLANMSHEIRTPMNAILGMAEMLGETDLNAEQKKYVNVFENSARGLLQIINQILDMSRVEIGEIQIENAPFSLPPLLEEIQILFEARAKQKGLGFHTFIDPRLALRLVGDSLRVKQVIVNLVANAFKFTFQGEIQVRAQLVDTTHYQIQVIDTGIGISAEHREHVFERFTQADASIARRFGGTGLGLSIAKSLAELMGGTITLDSREGQGSTFTLHLPYQEAGASAASAPEKIPSAIQTVHNKFLVVDDVPENLMVVSLYLKSMRIEFDTANNGREACDLALKNSYDLIIMDIQMPIMDGVEALKQIRQQEKDAGQKAVPIVALSAFAMEHEQRRYLEEGFNAYLTKPVRKSELLKMIHQQLG